MGSRGTPWYIPVHCDVVVSGAGKLDFYLTVSCSSAALLI